VEFYNINFEQSVLSSVIMAFTPEDSEEMMSQLSMDIFYLPAHQNIYAAINTLNKTNKPVDEEFIKATLESDKKFDEQVMLEVIMKNPMSNIEPYVTELKALYRKRKLDMVAINMQKMLRDDNEDADVAQAYLELELQRLEESSGVGMPITMAQAIYDYDHMQEPPKVKTGIDKFDEMLCGGIEPAQLVHIGGEKNVGKTTILKQILYHTSNYSDNLFFSFEMPAWKMAKHTKKMSGTADLNRYRIVDTQMMKSRDVMDVARMIRMMHRKHGIRFVLIDSKMKLTHKTFQGTNDGDRKGDIDAILNAVIQETGIVIMMITQLRKNDIENGTMSNYGSGLSDYEADMQIMMYHSKDNDGAVELKVSKNRQEVQHEPIKLWLNTDELKFTDRRMVETVYTFADEDIGHTSKTYQTLNDTIEIEVI
jgi:replicative DNA helicase